MDFLLEMTEYWEKETPLAGSSLLSIRITVAQTFVQVKGAWPIKAYKQVFFRQQSLILG
jgi:hypothetical protein